MGDAGRIAERLRPSWHQGSDPASAVKRQRFSSKKLQLLQQIEAMADPLGRTLYRGILKSAARVWNPADIRQSTVLKKILISMQSAEHSLGRFEAARSKIGPDELEVMMHPFKVRSVAQLDSLETLQQLVAAAEEKASQTEAT